MNRFGRKSTFIVSILLALAILVSFVAAELVVRYVVRYPTWGVASFVEGLDILSAKNGRTYKPYAKLWATEGGNIIIGKNNIGLTGADVFITPDSKNIFLMGTSFLEAVETPREKTASYIFQNMAQKFDRSLQIINIAYRNSDPYAQLYRLLFYKNLYRPTAGVILLDNIYSDNFWKQRYGKSRTFEVDKGNFKVNTSIKTNALRILRNSSAYINLCVRLGGNDANRSNERNDAYCSEEINAENYEYSYSVYEKVLNNMNQILNGNLIVVSIAHDPVCSEEIGKICQRNNISYHYQRLVIPENQINGIGHLNLKGNYKLGQFLFESLKKASTKINMQNNL